MSIESDLRQAKIDIASLQSKLRAIERITQSLPGKLIIKNNVQIDGEISGTNIIVWQSYSPSFTGFSVDPSDVVARYCQAGNLCYVSVYMGTAGTSNANSFMMSAPLTSKSVTGTMFWYNSLAYYKNNDVVTRGGGIVRIPESSAIFTLFSTTSVWVTSGNKIAFFQIAYEV